MPTKSAELIFNSLDSFGAFQRLIDEGEFESQYLECKAPGAPLLDRGLKSQLSEAISGFSNSGGGVIIWGIATTKQSQTGLDVLTQIQEIGSVKRFQSQIELAIPTLSTPNVDLFRTKVITRTPSDTRGLVVTLIPPTSGDPIQTQDGKFYLRIKDEFKEMPYETLKRMFAGSVGPDLYPLIDNRLVKLQQDGSWKIPIVLENKSSAAARDVKVSVTVQNPDACERVSSQGFKDQSGVNPGKKIFMAEIEKPIHRGLNFVVGELIVKMKKVRLPRRRLDMTIGIYATNMRAKTSSVTVSLTRGGLRIKRVESGYLY